MRQWGTRTRAFGGIVAFCALAFAPIDQAAAGCGDYLTMDHGAATGASHAGAPMKPISLPCNGPNCSRQEAPPLTPAPEVPTAPPSVKAAAIFASAGSDPQTCAERWQEPGTRPLPGFAASILRPPRSV